MIRAAEQVGGSRYVIFRAGISIVADHSNRAVSRTLAFAVHSTGPPGSGNALAVYASGAMPVQAHAELTVQYFVWWAARGASYGKRCRTAAKWHLDGIWNRLMVRIAAVSSNGKWIMVARGEWTVAGTVREWRLAGSG